MRGLDACETAREREREILLRLRGWVRRTRRAEAGAEVGVRRWARTWARVQPFPLLHTSAPTLSSPLAIPFAHAFAHSVSLYCTPASTLARTPKCEQKWGEIEIRAWASDTAWAIAWVNGTESMGGAGARVLACKWREVIENFSTHSPTLTPHPFVPCSRTHFLPRSCPSTSSPFTRTRSHPHSWA
jgi:hypothetical protein